MTRKASDSSPPNKPRKASAVRGARSGRWVLQEAKARFSELVRRAKSDGPQHVTVHGREQVVVISSEDFIRLRGAQSGQTLIDALQASPHRDIDIEPKRRRAPVRGVEI